MELLQIRWTSWRVSRGTKWATAMVLAASEWFCRSRPRGSPLTRQTCLAQRQPSLAIRWAPRTDWSALDNTILHTRKKSYKACIGADLNHRGGGVRRDIYKSKATHHVCVCVLQNWLRVGRKDSSPSQVKSSLKICGAEKNQICYWWVNLFLSTTCIHFVLHTIKYKLLVVYWRVTKLQL